jgi:hypothetical protein
MSLISIITLFVSITLLISLFLHKKALNEDYNYYCLTGKHLYDQEKLKEYENILFWAAICNLILALLNLFYFFFK